MMQMLWHDAKADGIQIGMIPGGEMPIKLIHNADAICQAGSSDPVEDIIQKLICRQIRLHCGRIVDGFGGFDDCAQ